MGVELPAPLLCSKLALAMIFDNETFQNCVQKKLFSQEICVS